MHFDRHAGFDKSSKPTIAKIGADRNDDGGAHAMMLAQHSLDFPKLDPESPDLHLLVAAA